MVAFEEIRYGIMRQKLEELCHFVELGGRKSYTERERENKFF